MRALSRHATAGCERPIRKTKRRQAAIQPPWIAVCERTNPTESPPNERLTLRPRKAPPWAHARTDARYSNSRLSGIGKCSRSLCCRMSFSENRFPPIGSSPRACFSGTCSRSRRVSGRGRPWSRCAPAVARRTRRTGERRYFPRRRPTFDPEPRAPHGEPRCRDARPGCRPPCVRHP
jgi:hypothetical protein